MTKEEFLKLGEEAQRALITDLAELWSKKHRPQGEKKCIYLLSKH